MKCCILGFSSVNAPWMLLMAVFKEELFSSKWKVTPRVLRLPVCLVIRRDKNVDWFTRVTWEGAFTVTWPCQDLQLGKLVPEEANRCSWQVGTLKSILNTELFNNLLSSFHNNLGWVGWWITFCLQNLVRLIYFFSIWRFHRHLTCGRGRPISAQLCVSYQNITSSILSFTSKMILSGSGYLVIFLGRCF